MINCEKAASHTSFSEEKKITFFHAGPFSSSFLGADILQVLRDGPDVSGGMWRHLSHDDGKDLAPWQDVKCPDGCHDASEEKNLLLHVVFTQYLAHLYSFIY